MRIYFWYAYKLVLDHFLYFLFFTVILFIYLIILQTKQNNFLLKTDTLKLTVLTFIKTKFEKHIRLSTRHLYIF